MHRTHNRERTVRSSRQKAPKRAASIATAALAPRGGRGGCGCWHPSGTCRMGRADDPMAVTDPTGRVYGVESLRVCDASIFPCVPRANTNIPTIMCAEKISDAIKAA